MFCPELAALPMWQTASVGEIVRNTELLFSLSQQNAHGAEDTARQGNELASSAQALAARGAQVLVSARGASALDTLVAEHRLAARDQSTQRPLQAWPLDVTDATAKLRDVIRRLQAEGAGDSYSMAAHLAGRGVVVVLLDHPGVGESDVPHDAYTLTPATVAAITSASSCV